MFLIQIKSSRNAVSQREIQDQPLRQPEITSTDSKGGERVNNHG